MHLCFFTLNFPTFNLNRSCSKSACTNMLHNSNNLLHYNIGNYDSNSLAKVSNQHSLAHTPTHTHSVLGSRLYQKYFNDFSLSMTRGTYIHICVPACILPSRFAGGVKAESECVFDHIQNGPIFLYENIGTLIVLLHFGITFHFYLMSVDKINSYGKPRGRPCREGDF